MIRYLSLVFAALVTLLLLALLERVDKAASG